jgi:hypothetical protein
MAYYEFTLDITGFPPGATECRVTLHIEEYAGSASTRVSIVNDSAQVVLDTSVAFYPKVDLSPTQHVWFLIEPQPDDSEYYNALSLHLIGPYEAQNAGVEVPG